MPVVQNIPRRQCIPIIYTRGTHYDVGYDVVSVPLACPWPSQEILNATKIGSNVMKHEELH